MMIFKESDVLDQEFRAKVIEEIKGSENQARKAKQYKRYEVYNDKVNKYTEELLLKQFEYSTVQEMKISLTNVSLMKKIINKIARVYSCGVERTVSKKEQKSIDEFSKYLCFNENMKKANRYLEVHNNIWAMILPYAYRDYAGEVLYYDLKMSIVPPFLFDVIEDQEDRECAKCLILSNFDPGGLAIQSDDPGRLGKRNGINNIRLASPGDRKDQVIADTPNDFDEKNEKYVWWTNSYHFSTDAKGNILGDPAEISNPIEEIPGVPLNKDQDGNYYSISGDDLYDSCLLTNAMLTNINHIGIQQGYGQAYMVGKNLPSQVRLGPTHVIKLEPSSDGEKTEFGYASSNPPLAELKELTITQIALLLSTNNLSTSNVKVDLSTTQSYASGISQLIDKSELIEDIGDQRQIFLDAEPELWEIAYKWLDVYRSSESLSDELDDVKNVNLDNLSIKFGDPRPIVSEKEKLDNMKLRKDLGIATTADLLKLDNPDLTDEEIQVKVGELDEEKQKSIEEAKKAMGDTSGELGQANGEGPADQKAKGKAGKDKAKKEEKASIQ